MSLPVGQCPCKVYNTQVRGTALGRGWGSVGAQGVFGIEEMRNVRG